MSLSQRDTLFLAEMGIKPVWQLRRQPDGAPLAPALPPEAAAAVAAFPGQAEPAAVDAAPAEPSALVSAAAELAPTEAAPIEPAPVDPAASITPARPGAAPAGYAPGFIVPPPRDPAWGAVPRTTAPPPPAWTPPAPPVVQESGDSAAQIAEMDWDQLNEAIARCSRCGNGGNRGSSANATPGAPGAARRIVPGAGARSARWFVAAGACSGADEAAGAPLAGEAGILLDNMLAAVGHARSRDVFVTNLVKCRPLSANGADRAPTAEEAAACRPFLARELALTGAATVLTLGQIAANGLLDKPLQAPLAGARGAVHAFAGAALVATLHPGELLRRGADKALAWEDLCRARASDAAATR